MNSNSNFGEKLRHYGPYFFLTSSEIKSKQSHLKMFQEFNVQNNLFFFSKQFIVQLLASAEYYN